MLRRAAAALCALTLATAIATAAAAQPAERILIYKAEHKLVVVAQGRAYRTYRVALGKTPRGAKLCRGDNRTPEGAYFVTRRMPGSHYYMALHLSYPNPDDVVRATDSGCEPGGDIEIHGLTEGFGWVGERHLEHDWTNGCIAVTNREIAELYHMVAVGTPVEIYP